MPIFRRSKHLTIILTHTYVFVNAVAYDKRRVLVGLNTIVTKSQSHGVNEKEVKAKQGSV